MSQYGRGKAVRFLRKEAGLTQIKLVVKSEVSVSWLARIESGKVDPPEIADDFEETAT